jgi:phytoene/squalene synthetase
VRFADEIVDTYRGNEKELILKEFREETFKAIQRKISFNPIIHSFQLTVNHYQIEPDLISAFLDSMAMDIHQNQYNNEEYKKYIYGSAKVVGLMCLHVFVSNQQDFKRLKPYALSLGAAFQKINFLRDLQSDYLERGRVYFPAVDFSKFNPKDKIQIESEIASDFSHAFEGIKQLPNNSQLGVLLAYKYYMKLFASIKAQPIENLLRIRIRISNFEKILILIRVLLVDSILIRWR